MEQALTFVGGMLLVVFIGFIAYKVKQSKDKPNSTGGGSGGGGGTRPNIRQR